MTEQLLPPWRFSPFLWHTRSSAEKGCGVVEREDLLHAKVVLASTLHSPSPMCRSEGETPDPLQLLQCAEERLKVKTSFSA